MDDPPWKQLIRELRERGHRSVHLDRLESRMHAIRGTVSLEQEMLQEMASSLRRAEDRIDLALLELEVLDREISAAHGERRGVLIDRFNAKREEARTHVRNLLIQREAIGFRGNEVLAQLYPIPPARRR